MAHVKTIWRANSLPDAPLPNLFWWRLTRNFLDSHQQDKHNAFKFHLLSVDDACAFHLLYRKSFLALLRVPIDLTTAKNKHKSNPYAPNEGKFGKNLVKNEKSGTSKRNFSAVNHKLQMKDSQTVGREQASPCLCSRLTSSRLSLNCKSFFSLSNYCKRFVRMMLA